MGSRRGRAGEGQGREPCRFTAGRMVYREEITEEELVVGSWCEDVRESPPEPSAGADGAPSEASGRRLGRRAGRRWAGCGVLFLTVAVHAHMHTHMHICCIRSQTICTDVPSTRAK